MPRFFDGEEPSPSKKTLKRKTPEKKQKEDLQKRTKHDKKRNFQYNIHEVKLTKDPESRKNVLNILFCGVSESSKTKMKRVILRPVKVLWGHDNHKTSFYKGFSFGKHVLDVLYIYDIGGKTQVAENVPEYMETLVEESTQIRIYKNHLPESIKQRKLLPQDHKYFYRLAQFYLAHYYNPEQDDAKPSTPPVTPTKKKDSNDVATYSHDAIQSQVLDHMNNMNDMNDMIESSSIQFEPSPSLQGGDIPQQIPSSFDLHEKYSKRFQNFIPCDTFRVGQFVVSRRMPAKMTQNSGLYKDVFIPFCGQITAVNNATWEKIRDYGELRINHGKGIFGNPYDLCRMYRAEVYKNDPTTVQEVWGVVDDETGHMAMAAQKLAAIEYWQLKQRISEGKSKKTTQRAEALFSKEYHEKWALIVKFVRYYSNKLDVRRAKLNVMTVETLYQACLKEFLPEKHPDNPLAKEQFKQLKADYTNLGLDHLDTCIKPYLLVKQES